MCTSCTLAGTLLVLLVSAPASAACLAPMRASASHHLQSSCLLIVLPHIGKPLTFRNPNPCQISLINDFGGVNWGDDAPATPPCSVGTAATPSGGAAPHLARESSGGASCGHSGAAGDAEGGAAAACAESGGAARGPSAPCTPRRPAAGAAAGGEAADSPCDDGSGDEAACGGAASGTEGGGDRWCGKPPAACSQAQQRKCIEHIKRMSADEIKGHWRRFLEASSRELMALQRAEEAAAAAAAAQPPVCALADAAGAAGGAGVREVPLGQAGMLDPCPPGANMKLPEGAQPGGPLARIYQLVGGALVCV